MTTAASAAFGTTFKKGSTAIAEGVNITGPGIKADTIDVTNHDSTNGWREYIGGLLDGGEVTIEGNYLPANATQQAIFTDLAAKTIATYNLVCSDGGAGTWSFSAMPTAFEPNAPVDGKLGFRATFKVTGAVSFAA